MQQAFPSPGVVTQSGSQQGAYAGMTLRDYFAAQAMQQYLAANLDTRYHIVDIIAELSYKMADAMIRARGGY